MSFKAGAIIGGILFLITSLIGFQYCGLDPGGSDGIGAETFVCKPPISLLLMPSFIIGLITVGIGIFFNTSPILIAHIGNMIAGILIGGLIGLLFKKQTGYVYDKTIGRIMK